MKTFSIAIISFTLLLFYNLALQQQNERNLEPVETIYHEKIESHRSNETSDTNEVEEFSMHVTGKEHRYLNIGISYIEEPLEKMNRQCIADNTKESNLELSGS